MDRRPKPLVWLHAYVKTPPFTAEARIEAGVLLRQLQEGISLTMPHSRPMPGIGRGCHELRIQDQSTTWRVIYCIDSVAIVILEVFAKTSNQTPHSVIDTSKARLKNYKSIQHGET